MSTEARCATSGCDRAVKARGFCNRCYQREWQQRAPGKSRRLAAARAWKARNPGRAQAYRNAYNHREREELGDSYVRRQLAGRRAGVTYPPDLIEAKRAQLKLLRLVKEMTT